MPEPRHSLPPAWAKQGRCPVCAGGLLEVRHHPNQADQLACLRCDTAFEVEDGGARVRLTHAPPRYQAALGQWLTFAQVAQQAAAPPVALPAAPASPIAPTNAPSVAPPAAPPSPQPAPDRTAEALAHARGLLRLGNTPAQIERTLLSWEGLTATQRAHIVATVRAESQIGLKKQARWGWLVGVLAVLAVLALGLAGVWYAQNAPARPAQGQLGANPALVNQPPTAALPPALQTLVPPGVTILQPATPAIQRGEGPPPSGCPSTPAQAAALFGGQASEWQADPNGTGWLLVALNPVSVRVPEGMTLGYMTLAGSGSIQSLAGPATVDNLNFAAITCE